MRSTIEELTKRLGPDSTNWQWGKLHGLVQKHFLSGRGDLGLLLDRSGTPTRGDGTTVCNSGSDANQGAWIGAGYRMVADLADPLAGIWATEVASTSGHPGSPHYDDQLHPWNEGGYHYLALNAAPEGDGFILKACR
jgi:penicillin amidase